MISNVVHLPRPHGARPSLDPPGLFVRVGYDDHREMLELIAVGERKVSGSFMAAQNVERHRELMTEAQGRDIDLILDPVTQPMGLPGGHRAQLAALPCGLDRYRNLSDFKGPAGGCGQNRLWKWQQGMVSRKFSARRTCCALQVPLGYDGTLP